MDSGLRFVEGRERTVNLQMKVKNEDEDVHQDADQQVKTLRGTAHW